MKTDLSTMIQELLDAGEIVRKGEDYYEDMGGHIIHESGLPEVFAYYINHLPREEREALIEKLKE